MSRPKDKDDYVDTRVLDSASKAVDDPDATTVLDEALRRELEAERKRPKAPA